ncbi:MAG: DNA repair protein RadC [Chlamydiales bacterium]|nr:DNA repair protein RadC [Chlamydiia bacterium]MCP5508136.1 DNA repair protein RadC [Chlamydiales bacterium]
MHYSIQRLPESERPRERLLKYGTESISTTELLAILLGSGMKGKSVLQLSQEIISYFGGIKELSEATVEELCQIKGLGIAKAIQIKACLSLGMRAVRSCDDVKFKIESPLHVYNLLKDDLSREKRELFIVILQDTKGRVIACHTVSVGTLSRTLVHPREVFYPAIRHKAASIIVAHNHPSGDPEPSEQDILITKKLIEVGQVMGIPVNDHIIIAGDSYLSFRQRKLAFN